MRRRSSGRGDAIGWMIEAGLAGWRAGWHWHRRTGTGTGTGTGGRAALVDDGGGGRERESSGWKEKWWWWAFGARLMGRLGARASSFGRACFPLQSLAHGPRGGGARASWCARGGLGAALHAKLAEQSNIAPARRSFCLPASNWSSLICHWRALCPSFLACTLSSIRNHNNAHSPDPDDLACMKDALFPPPPARAWEP